MKTTLCRTRSVAERPFLRLLPCWMAGLAALGALSASAGTFSADFNSGLPSGTTINGNALILSSGGYTNSGYLQLTTNLASQNGGTFIITNDLDAGASVVAFIAKFKALIGGGNGADGMSFNFAPDLPVTGGFAEEGAGSGLTVSFDTYTNESDNVGVELKCYGSSVAYNSAVTLRVGAWVDVEIDLKPNGNVDVLYNGAFALTNVPCGFSPSAGLFGWGARSGGLYDNHWVDNVSITTFTSAKAFVDTYSPVGPNIRADSPIQIVLQDTMTQVNQSSIVLKVDGTQVTPTITQASPATTIKYVPGTFWTSGSTHAVSLTFADNDTPTPQTTTLDYTFTISTYGTLNPGLAADPSFVSLSAPGFGIRYSQTADAGARDITRAELQLANLLLDNTTGLPFENLAAPNPVDSTFTRSEPGTINYGLPAGSLGEIPSDTDMPGLPGPTTGNGNSYAMEALTYLHLAPGLYTLGVNSSDGFRLTTADGPDVFAPVQAVYPNVRAAGTTLAAFTVATDGYYPFRLVYFTGDPAYGPGPGTSLPSVEFFNIDSTGARVLVNDTATTGYLPAFQAAKTKPYVRSVSPAVNETGVPGNAIVNAVLVDGSLTVQDASVSLWFNSAAVTPGVSRSGSTVTVIYDPPGDLAPNSTNTVTLAFTDSGAARRTNTWQFVAANIFQEIWSIAPGSAPYVTSGSTERGLAYNPKTGHLLLVSRASAVGSLEIEVLSSTSGAKVGTLDKTGISGGLFPLNQIDVAEDGVIYGANMTTSASVNNSRIYRWADESAAPLMVYNDNPANPGNLGSTTYTMRLGDILRVRGSGAGTQILMGQNSSTGSSDIGGGTNVVLFTTVDGTNFTAKRIPVRGINNGDVRLGIAFGCGNTLYGIQTGGQLRNVAFDPVAGTASLLTSYVLTNPISTATIGPLGLDLLNQRIVGNATSANAAQHSMNLYDMSTLVPAPTPNVPLDTRVFHTANTAFGTGAIDFSPDGTKIFALDTANGVIAFSVTAKLAAPVICAQPQNLIVADIGSLGFMGVTAIGAPQKYQWRFSGSNPAGPATPLANATNRTLDIYNVQQSQLGYYSVVITNSLGSATSSVAYLDTLIRPTISPAEPHAPAPGDSLTLTVNITGGLPAYTYQWLKNGTNVAGATASSLPFSSIATTDGGSYSVTVTDVLGQSVTAAAVTVSVGPWGTGDGVTAAYYNLATFTDINQAGPFLGAPALTEIETNINFNWAAGNLPSGVADYAAVRFFGQVQAVYSQPYTFHATTDDGVRVWVDGRLVISSWKPQSATETSGTAVLAAGQKYDLVMEYYEQTGSAVATLSWSGPYQPKELIPMRQLYSMPAGVFQSRFAATRAAGSSVIIDWAGTCILEAAPAITGPWTPVTTNAGPFTIDATAAAQQYFRLIGQQAF